MTLAAPPARSLSPRAGFALAVAAIALVGVFKAVAADTADPDSFWHLRVAHQIASEGVKPLVDRLSFESLKTPWTPYSWLGELIMRGVWLAGGYRLAIVVQAFCSAAMIVFSALACAHAARDGRATRYGICALLTVFVAFFSLAYLSFRPVTFVLAGLAACVWLVERDRLLQPDRREPLHTYADGIWLIPFLTAVMVNIHLTAVFVPLMMTARVAGKACRLRATALAAACWAALCYTPMLPGMIRTAWHYQTADALVASGQIAEMKPFYSGTIGMMSAALVIGLIVLLFVRRKRLDVGDWLVVALAGVALLRWGRFAPVFAILTAPVFARALAGMGKGLLDRPKVRFALGAFVMIELYAIGVHFPRPGITFDAWLNRNGPETPGYPTSAAAYVETHFHDGGRRIINEFSWGGYLSWRLPEYRVFSDGRTQLYSTKYWQTAWLGTEAEKQAALDAADGDVAILPANHSAYFQPLTNLGWRTAYEDDRARVMVPPAGRAKFVD